MQSLVVFSPDPSPSTFPPFGEWSMGSQPVCVNSWRWRVVFCQLKSGSGSRSMGGSGGANSYYACHTDRNSRGRHPRLDGAGSVDGRRAAGGSPAGKGVGSGRVLGHRPLGVGTVAAMAILFWGVGRIAVRFAGRGQSIYRGMTTACGVAALCVGVFWLATSLH